MLRPTFNQRIFNKLLNGNSLNLVGLRGSGCSKVLKEVKEMASTRNDILVFLIDMRRFKYNFKGLLEEINRLKIEQASKLLAPPDRLLPIPAPKDLSNLLTMQNIGTAKIFLLLDHFDAVLDLKDQRMPKSFFDDLNSWRHKDGFSLICVTQKPHLTYRVYFEDEIGRMDDRMSWLDLDHIDLEPLLEEEIVQELNRVLKHIPFWEQEPKEPYLKLIKGHKHPIHLLATFLDDFEAYPDKTKPENRVIRIGHKYRERYGNRPKAKKITKWDKLISRLKEISEIWKNLNTK